jgi:hypothetical protein
LESAKVIRQVVQTVKTDTFSSASTTYTAVTGLTVTITPSTNTNKILLIAQISGTHSSINSGDKNFLRFTGGNAGTYIGNAAGSRERATMGSTVASQSVYAGVESLIAVYLDSPATSSAITYGLEHRSSSVATFYVNRSQVDTDNSSFGRYASSITAIEVAA